jgi:hypothetical protein
MDNNAAQHVSISFGGTSNTQRLQVEEAPQSGYHDNAFMVAKFPVNAVPEASTAGMWLMGLAGLAASVIHRQRSQRFVVEVVERVGSRRFGHPRAPGLPCRPGPNRLGVSAKVGDVR